MTQTGLVTRTTENLRRATTSSSTDVAQHSAGVSRSRPQLLFFSSEAENQGVAAAVKEALYLKQLLKDLGIQQKHQIAIGEDNQSCIKLCQNAVMHKRSKHIETKFHFIRDKTEDFNSLRSY